MTHNIYHISVNGRHDGVRLREHLTGLVSLWRSSVSTTSSGLAMFYARRVKLSPRGFIPRHHDDNSESRRRSQWHFDHKIPWQPARLIYRGSLVAPNIPRRRSIRLPVAVLEGLIHCLPTWERDNLDTVRALHHRRQGVSASS